MLFASTYRIKQFRKALGAIGQALFLPRILSNKFAQFDYGLTIKNFVMRKYGHLQSDTPIKVKLAFTFDGTRYGSKGLTLGGFKLLESQSRDDCFVLAIFLGKDTSANAFTYFGSMFRFAESINDKIFNFNGNYFFNKVFFLHM
jgi:hypothetical protein